MNNPSVKEIQVNSKGGLEISYQPHCEETYNILNKYNRSFDDYYNHGTLGMVSESDDTLALVYDVPSDDKHQDYMVLKYKDGNMITKKYMRDFWDLPNIQLPKGARLANQFGIGYYPELMGTSDEKFDMYFFSNNQDSVEQHFKAVIGKDIKNDLHYYKWENGLYGVTYTKDLSVLNLKRYLYPFDPYCKNPSYI